MNRIILLTIFSCFVFFAEAQITVGSSSFPQIGDTLYTSTDNLPMNIDVLYPGEDLNWHFTYLQAPFSQETIFEPADQGEGSEHFSGADMLINLGDLGERYYRTDNNHYELLGAYGDAPVDFGFKLALKYDNPLIERRAPMQYGDENTLENRAFRSNCIR